MLPARADVDHGPFDEILQKHVRGERVDYLMLRKQDWGALSSYLDALAAVDTDKLAQPEQLAYYINLYNATVLQTVIERFRAGYSVSENEFKVFDEPLVRLKGKRISLNDLEHKVIRKRFDEPRIHVALVCAARSCPPLLDRAYHAKNLDQTLETQMRAFLRDESRNRIDRDARKLHLSKIFEWFAEDFGGKRKLDNYVNGYVAADVQGYEITFLEYDWSLNLAPPTEGRWVRIKVSRAPLFDRPGGTANGGLEQDAVVEVTDERDEWLKVHLPQRGHHAWVRAAQTTAYDVRG